MVLVSDGDQQDHAGYVAKSIELPYVVSELVGKSHGVSSCPMRCSLMNNSVSPPGDRQFREHIDSLFEAKERGVASIQDYMNKRVETPFVEANHDGFD